MRDKTRVASTLAILFYFAIGTHSTVAGEIPVNKPTKTFVMHALGPGESGEIRLYDHGGDGTTIDVSLLPWLDDGAEVILFNGSCHDRSYKPVAHLKLEPIPQGVDVNMRPLVLPSPLQEVWGHSSRSHPSSLVDHGFSIVALDVHHKAKWCGSITEDNEGDPLPANY